MRSWHARLSSPAGLAVAVAAGLVAGGLVASAFSAGRADADRDGTVRLLGGIVYQPAGPAAGSTARVRVDVLTVNTGPEAVRVTAAGFGGPTATTLELAGPFDVEPGASVREPATLRVDCSDPRLPPLVLTVGTRDGEVRTVVVEPGDLEDAALLARRHLGQVCVGPGRTTALDVSSTTSRDDGTLAMVVRNDLAEGVELSFQGPDGIRVVTEPDTPVPLDAGSSVVLVVRLEVDSCAAALDRLGDGDHLELLLDGEPGRAQVERAETTAWVEREVASRCPG